MTDKYSMYDMKYIDSFEWPEVSAIFENWIRIQINLKISKLTVLNSLEF